MGTLILRILSKTYLFTIVLWATIGSFSCTNTLLEDIAFVQGTSNSVVNQQIQGVSVTPGALAGEISLSWTPLAEAHGYHIYYSTTAGECYFGSRDGNISTNSATLFLASNVKYYFCITAYDNFGESTPSAEIAATTP